MSYFLYDAAVNGLYTLLYLQQNLPVHQCLFKGTKDETLIDVAPHLFKVKDEQVEWKNAELSLKEIVVIESSVELSILAQHLKQFIYQQFEGRECYFRFWDARVLKKFLTNCSRCQLRVFFGPIDSFTIRNEQSATQFSFDSHDLIIKQGKLQELSPLLYTFSTAGLQQENA